MHYGCDTEEDFDGYGADDGVSELFGEDVDEIVWRERIDDVAPAGAEFVDVVVSSTKPAILKTDRKIALGYWPSGPVVKGVQNYSEGQTLGFYKVPVKPGAELVLVASSSMLEGSLAANVQVTDSGGGSRVVEAKTGQQQNPLDQLFGNLGWGLVAIVGALVLFEVIKGEVKA
jgi:hypothetical protein